MFNTIQINIYLNLLHFFFQSMNFEFLSNFFATYIILLNDGAVFADSRIRNRSTWNRETSLLRTPRLTERVLACARVLAVRTGYIGTVHHLFSLHLLLFFHCSSADLSFFYPSRVSWSANPPLHNAVTRARARICVHVYVYTIARLSAYSHA